MFNTKITAIYEETLFDFPYNSFASVYGVLGFKSPEKLGGNCADQAERVHRHLKTFLDSSQQPYQLGYLLDQRHHATLLHLNGHSYLFDPYVLHESVIDASKILSSGIGEIFNAYPKENVYNFLKVTPLNATKLLLEKHRFNAKINQYGITQFWLDTGLPQDQRIPVTTDIIAYHPEQTTLSIRILDKNSGQLTHVIYPVAQLFDQRSVDKKYLQIKLNDGSSITDPQTLDFINTFQQISQTLNSSPSELLDYMMHGVELYFKYAPKKINFNSKNPVNQ